MNGFFMIDEYNRQIVVIGVEGAGRKSFCSLYFPKMERTEKQIRSCLAQKVPEESLRGTGEDSAGFHGNFAELYAA